MIKATAALFWILVMNTGDVASTQIIVTPTYDSCVARSQFEMRFNPRITFVSCAPWDGTEA